MNVYVAVLLISFVYVVVAPYLPDRAKLMILSLVVISVGMGIDYLLLIYKNRNVLISLSVLMGIAQITAYMEAYQATHEHMCYTNKVIEIIESEKVRGNLDVEIPPYQVWSRFCASSHSSSLSEDSTDWANRAFAKYYGLNSIVVKKSQ